MANETSKQMLRRSSDRRFATRWIIGHGIDIGCGPDPLSNLSDFFPLMKSLKPWDISDGDAMVMAGVDDNIYDFVHSSHCLEHLSDPYVALENWIRICKSGGHLVITIPDEDLYEQGVWPSTFNEDHKWTFTILKSKSWSPKSINIFNLLLTFQDQLEILKIEKLDSGFFYNQSRRDQTLGSLSESAIEIVCRKRLSNQHIVKSHAIESESTLLELASKHLDNQKFEEAKDLYLSAIVQNPDNQQIIIGLSKCYAGLQDFAAAIKVLREKIKLFTHLDDIYVTIAKYYEYLGNTDDAINFLNEAILLNPEHIMAHVQLGHQQLKRGNFQKGTEEIEWIWRNRITSSQIGLFVNEFGKPIRQDGRIIVLSADSGLGDTIQFVRYAKSVKELGAHVIVECQSELVRLIENSSYVDEVVEIGQLKNNFDLRIPMHNLMGAFRSTIESIPNSIPYIYPYAKDVITFKDRISEYSHIRIGIVWSGNPNHPRNTNRSVNPMLLPSLLKIEGTSFFSLQKGSEYVFEGLTDWSSEFQDMATTAALINNLDLIISVDSSVAHLAGAMGKPVWLLNRYDSCWRWLEDRVDSPWYPSLTQFRQRLSGEWGEVINEVKKRLQAIVMTH